MNILIINRQRKTKLNTRDLRVYTQSAIELIEATIGKKTESDSRGVSIVFTGDRAMRKYNREFRGKDKPTDVLSFPSDSDDSEFADYLGDIIISTETASRDAKELNLTFEVELRMLILHGLLHLYGYDHEVDRGEMSRLERRLRRRLL
ncbi:MAG TPA: rRNA maturation RNase YbeY [Blastocatellia bacterium]|nr:rRNA maturation RNase YbeY [Blastocatellia bacterium]